jgi:hypothetical protein
MDSASGTIAWFGDGAAGTPVRTVAGARYVSIGVIKKNDSLRY